MTALRSRLIRLASQAPPGSELRREVLRLVAYGKNTPQGWDRAEREFNVGIQQVHEGISKVLRSLDDVSDLTDPGGIEGFFSREVAREIRDAIAKRTKRWESLSELVRIYADDLFFVKSKL